MLLRKSLLKRISWKAWCGLLLAAVGLPSAALLGRAGEPADDRPNLLGAPIRPILRGTHPSQDQHSIASTGKLVVCTYDLADVVERFRAEVDERDSNAHLTIEWFVKRAAPGPWKTKGMELADPREIERLPPATQQAIQDNDAARFELGWVADKLIVVHTAAGQALIEDRLELLKTHGFSQVSIEVRIISGQALALDRVASKWELIGATANGLTGIEHDNPISLAGDRLGADREPVFQSVFESVIQKHVPAIVALLNDDEAKLLIEAAQSNSRSNIMFAPKVTVFNGESACIEDTTQRPFVVGTRSVPGGGHHPQVQIVSEGTAIRVRPELRSDDKVFVDLGIVLSSIRGVETVHVPFAGHKHTIGVQIPEVVTNRLQSAVEMQLDQMLAIGFPAAAADKSFQPGCILVKVRKIEDSMIADARSATVERVAPTPTP